MTTTNSYFPQSNLLHLPLNSIILSTRQRQRQGIVRSFTTSKNKNNDDNKNNEDVNNSKNKPEQSETSPSSSKNDNSTGQQQPHPHGQIHIQEFMDNTVSTVRPIVDSTIKKAKDTLNTGDLLSVYSIVFLIFLIVTAPYVARYVTFCFVLFIYIFMKSQLGKH